MAPILESILPFGLSPLATLLILPAIAVLAVVYRVIYCLFFHPLKNFPGPWYAAVTSLPLGLVGASKGEPRWLTYLAEKYGTEDGMPIRIAPDLLLFYKAHQLRDIYWDAACNTRGGMYQHEAIGPISIFTTTGADEHRKLRKALAGQFWSLGYLKKRWESSIDDLITNWHANQMNHVKTGEPVILSNKTSEFAADVMTMSLFTKPWGFVENDRDERNMLLAWREGTALFGLAHRWRFMREVVLSSRLLRKWILPNEGDDYGNGWLMAQGLREIKDRQQVLEKGEETYTDALQHTIDARIDGEPLSDLKKLAHLTIMIQAGADTTGTGLGSTLSLLVRHPDILEKVRRELDEADAKGLLSPVVQFDETKKHLPYMCAVIKESLRVEPPIPNLFPRLSPSAEGKTIGGHHIPGNTQMLSHACVVHLDGAAFGANPEKFIPERWLESEERSVKMESSMFTFGMGSRSCLGKELALIEMHKLIPEVLRKFEMNVIDEGTYWACGGIAYLAPGLRVTLKARK